MAANKERPFPSLIHPFGERGYADHLVSLNRPLGDVSPPRTCLNPLIISLTLIIFHYPNMLIISLTLINYGPPSILVTTRRCKWLCTKSGIS